MIRDGKKIRLLGLETDGRIQKRPCEFLCRRIDACLGRYIYLNRCALGDVLDLTRVETLNCISMIELLHL